MQIHTFGLFLTTVLVLIITPGPDMIYVAGRSLSQGGKAAVFSALGVAIGYTGHTLLVALGLASILAASPVVFRVLQLGGATYLIYLAFTLLRSSGAKLQAEDSRNSSTGLLIRQGIFDQYSQSQGTIILFCPIAPVLCAGVTPRSHADADLWVGDQPALFYGL